jgi:hypothetical protein
MGNILVPLNLAGTGTGTVNVVATQFGVLNSALEERQMPGISLLATSGEICFTGLAAPSTTGEIRETFDLPPGTYWLLPCPLLLDGFQVGLLDAIASGADLTNCGVPKVTAVAGQTVDVQVDLMAAYRALHNLRVYSVQP